MQVSFIRHAETVGNLGRVWQGQGDSPLSELGKQQAAALGRRPLIDGFDLVVASDLGRAVETANIAGLVAEPEPAWREIDIGAWEGLTSVEIAALHPEELASVRRGEQTPLGGGESGADLAQRVDAALHALLERLDDGDHAAVVTHGGVIHSIVAGHLGLRDRPRPWPIGRIANTSVSTFDFANGRTMRTLSDASHTAGTSHPDELGTVVGLVRHGETEANVAGVWQGLTDGPLTDRGRSQAASLAAHYDGLAHVYTSDLQRARDTATALAEASGSPLGIQHDLHELDFGEWEDMSPEEIAARFPDEFEAIYVHGRDLPRGTTGETAEQMGLRMAAAIAEIAGKHPGDHVAAVSHGGAIRAYVAHLVGLSFADRSHLAICDNTGVSHVRATPHGPVLDSYNMRPWM